MKIGAAVVHFVIELMGYRGATQYSVNAGVLQSPTNQARLVFAAAAQIS